MKKQQKDKKVKKDRREKLRYIREVSAEQRGRILLSCLTGILGVAFALAFIYATKRVIDTATGITDDNLTHIAVLTVVLLTAQLLCGAADTWISTRMQIETGNALRHRLFSRLLQSRWNELERFHTGDVVNRVEQDTTAIVTLLTSSVPAFIVTSIQLLAAFLFFYFLDPSLPWLIVAILPVFLLGSRFYMRRMKRYTHDIRKYSINSLVYWVTYVHNVVYSFYRSMIYCYINSTQRCAGSIVIDIIPTNGADKRKFFPFAPYFPVTNVIKRYFYPYFPAIIGIKGYSFPYFPYLSGIMKIKTALYSLFSRLDWHKTVVFPCLGEIYEGIRSLSWEIPVT